MSVNVFRGKTLAVSYSVLPIKEASHVSADGDKPRKNNKLVNELKGFTFTNFRKTYSCYSKHVVADACRHGRKSGVGTVRCGNVNLNSKIKIHQRRFVISLSANSETMTGEALENSYYSCQKERKKEKCCSITSVKFILATEGKYLS